MTKYIIPTNKVAFTPGEIPGTHFQKMSRPQGTWFRRKEPRKESQVTPPGIDLGIIRLVAQRLNHYATPGPRDISINLSLYIFPFSVGITFLPLRLPTSPFLESAK